MATYSLNVNGSIRQVEADEDTPLLWVLRDELNLVGTKFGCGIAMCGACTVHMDGQAVRSCSMPVSSIGEKAITTIEGLSEKGDHPLQEAWKTVDVPQCGYCQAGQIMTAAAFLKENSNPNRDQVRAAMHGNLCRCAAYNRIEDAVMMASEKIR